MLEMQDLERLEPLDGSETPAPDPSPAKLGASQRTLPPKSKKNRNRYRSASRQRTLHNVLLSFAFFAVVLIFFIVNLAVKDKDFSTAENRSLAQKPALQWSALADGSYFSDLMDYVSDQHFFRDGWMNLKLRTEILLGRKEASGVYLGADDYLLSAPVVPDADALTHSINAINSFAAKHADLSVRMLLVPDAAAVLNDKLPRNAPVQDQLQDIKSVKGRLLGSIQFLDAAEALSAHSDEYIYYRTDHHWTSLGARYVFDACAGQLGIASAASAYDIHTVSDSFEGTLSSKSGSHQATDTIQVFTPQDTDIRYYVTYPDSTERVCSLYRSECLKDKDQYTVFFGGNYSKVEINTTADNERCLLVFKDSYANCFMQFLYPYYEKIIMIDPRYYYGELDPVLTSGVTDVLFLYSADTFFTDTSLVDVLESESESGA